RLSDDTETVPNALADLVDPLLLDEANRIWVYAGARKILEKWGRHPDIVYPLALVIEEFDIPPEYSHFLYYGSRKSFKHTYGEEDFFDALERRVESDRVQFGPVGNET